MNEQEVISQILENIYKHLGIDPNTVVEKQEEGVYKVIINDNDLNYLIGYRGTSLDALQNILRQITFKKTNSPVSISVDINGYKQQRIDRLLDMARKSIDKVRFFEKEVSLPPMKPWERREVHMLVSEYDDIVTESTGEGRYRHIVLKPSKA
jgi:spoIIIJ-associated protein